MNDVGVLIVAGGEATRLPGKLALDAGHVPLIVRVYRNVSPGHPTYVSTNQTFPPEIDRELPCPMVVDERPHCGPLGGMVSTMSVMPTPYVFAVAGDAPMIDAAFLARLAAARRPGDEAVVPVHTSHGKRRAEPLAALYDRNAFLTAGAARLRHGGRAVHRVLEDLRTHYVEIDDPKIFTNINTPDQYRTFKDDLRT